MTDYSAGYMINAAGYLVGDPLLTELWSAGFGVKLFEFGEDSNAGLESMDGEGRVPERDMMLRFADMQTKYRKELRIRQALLKQKRKGAKLR
jgi:hypothetical protein